MSETGYIVLYGIAAAFSPTVLLATFVVLGSGRGRLNGLVFLAAFTTGQVLAYLITLWLGTVISIGDDASRGAAVLEIAAGAALVIIAWTRRSLPRAEPAGPPRSQALFDRLSSVRPAISFGVGMPLGVGVKRLLITVLAATTVANAELDRVEKAAEGILYVTIATAVVWCPVLVYLVVGPRADRTMAEARAWITTHEREVLVYSALALGLLLVLDGVGRLLL